MQFALRTGNYGLGRRYLEMLIPVAVKGRDKMVQELATCSANGFADTDAAGLPYPPDVPARRYLLEAEAISVRAESTDAHPVTAPAYGRGSA